MSRDNSTGPARDAGRRRGLSALAITSLALVALAAGVVVWLAVTAPSPTPEEETGSPAVTVAIAPPTVTAPAPETHEGTGPGQAGTDKSKTGNAETATPPEEATPKSSPQAATHSANPAAEFQPPAATQKPVPAAPAPKPAEKKPPAETSPAPAAQTPPASQAKETPTVRSLPLPGDGLAKAPDPALIQSSRFGQLPRVAPDGRKAWQVYARPFDANDRRPRISIVMSNLGLSSAATQAAIQRLPGEVSLAFSPYAHGLEQWIALARAAGHEVLLDLPMEPINFPANDPGPDTLLTSLTAAQNRTRLNSILGRVTGYVGVVNEMGSRFTTSAPDLRPVLTELRDRGLLFVDSRASLRSVAARTATELGLPRVINNRFIDVEASRDAIDSRLKELERIARISGYAVGIGQPFPVTIDRLVLWTRDLKSRGFSLAPVSAMVNAQTE